MVKTNLHQKALKDLMDAIGALSDHTVLYGFAYTEDEVAALFALATDSDLEDEDVHRGIESLGLLNE